MKLSIIVRLGLLAGATLVVAVVLGAAVLRLGEGGTPPTGGASPTIGASPTPAETPGETCKQLSDATCERVRAEILRFIGPDRQPFSMLIWPSYICLGDPFEPITCPLPMSYLASAQVHLRDGEWAFVNVFETADGQLQTDGRILAAPAGWTPPK
jgi:hypothetical protein